MTPADLPALMARGKPDGICAAFLLCANPATTTMPHPILGTVSVCQSCFDKMETLR